MSTSRTLLLLRVNDSAVLFNTSLVTAPYPGGCAFDPRSGNVLAVVPAEGEGGGRVEEYGQTGKLVRTIVMKGQEGVSRPQAVMRTETGWTVVTDWTAAPRLCVEDVEGEHSECSGGFAPLQMGLARDREDRLTAVTLDRTAFLTFAAIPPLAAAGAETVAAAAAAAAAPVAKGRAKLG